MSVDDGGPAFPAADAKAKIDSRGEWVLKQPGMSLRDYFAARLLPAAYVQLIKDWRSGEAQRADDEFLAQMCYRFADAMLRTRETPARGPAPGEAEANPTEAPA